MKLREDKNSITTGAGGGGAGIGNTTGSGRKDAIFSHHFPIFNVVQLLRKTRLLAIYFFELNEFF